MLNRFISHYFKNYQSKKFRTSLILLWMTILLMFSIALPYLNPDFDFEKFFPTGDSELSFYKEHVALFDYDNDYITLIIENDQTIFQTDFLQKVHLLTSQLRQIAGIESVASPTEMQELIFSPMGTIAIPALHIKDSIKLKGESVSFSEHPIFGKLISADKQSLLLQIKHNHLESIEKSDELIVHLREAIENVDLKQTRLIGRIPAQNAFVSLIKNDFTLFLALALSFSFLLLKYFFISWKGAFIPFIIAISTLICTLGLMSLLNVPLSIIAVLIPPIILFTSTSDCVHLLNAYHQIRVVSENERLSVAIKKVFLPTLLTSITTAIGFISLIFMPIEPLRQFGIYSAIGVILAFVFTFLLTPIFIKNSGNVRVLMKPKLISSWFLKKGKTLSKVVLFIFVISTIGIYYLKLDAKLLADLPDEHQVKNNFNYLDQEFGGSKPWEIAIWMKDNNTIWAYEVAQQVDLIENFIIDSLKVQRVWSPLSMLKYGNHVLKSGKAGSFTFPTENDFSKVKKEIFKIYSSIPQPEVIAKNNQYIRIIGFIPQNGSLSTEKMNERLENYIQNNINKELINAKITGTTALIDRSHALISISMIQGLLLAIVLVSIILGLYFKSWALALVSIIPNVLPLIITAGIMGIFGITLNLTTSIIFAIAFGIAVDDTIHFISSFHFTKGDKTNRLVYTLETTGNGMLLTTLIVLAGFSVFLFSSFGATFYLGLFLVIALSSALIVDFTILPRLLSLLESKQEE